MRGVYTHKLYVMACMPGRMCGGLYVCMCEGTCASRVQGRRKLPMLVLTFDLRERNSALNMPG